MLLDAGIDTGAVLLKRAVPIAADETTASLTPRLADLGASVLLEVLPRWVRGELTPQPQEHAQATHTRMLKKEDGRLNWSLPAEVLARAVRAYTPWPNAYTTWRGKLLKILSASPSISASTQAEQPGKVALTTQPQAGTTQKALRIATGQGSLLVDRVQLEGKKAMSVDEFVRGYAQIVGEIVE
jgi:methionyl-tRNA formyltransferase